jgi:hypothetical protein
MSEFETDLKQAFRTYKALGDPVPIPYRDGLPTKRCLIPDWPAKAANGEFTEADFNEPCNIGLLTGGANNLTDFDLETPEAVKIGNKILSGNGPTMIFGRESKPRSHYLYAADRSLPSEKLYDPLDKRVCIIEYRCVDVDGTKRGHQTVVPPSIWCDSKSRKLEEVAFEEDSANEPLPIEASKLYEQFREIGATAILAKYSPAEHSRHNAHLALAGVFVRNGIDEERATRIVTLAYRYSAGYNNDVDSAASSVRSVYESFRKDPNTHLSGYPKLIEIIDKKVADEVLKLLGISRPTETSASNAKSSSAKRRSPESIERMLITQHLRILPIPEISYLVEPEIQKGFLICVTGKPGSGKTTIVP